MGFGKAVIGRLRRAGGARGGVRAWALMAVLIAFFMGAGAARGQAVKGEIVSVGIGGQDGKGGIYRAGSWVPVQVHLENRSLSAFTGHLGVEQPDLDGDKVLSVGPEFVLPPQADGRTLWTYYWPRPDDLDLNGITDLVVLDKDGQTAVAKISTPGSTAGARGIGIKDENMERSIRFVVLLGKQDAGWKSFSGAYGGVESLWTAWVNDPAQLPDDVKGFDGVDVIVWEADTVKPSEIPPEFQLKAMLEWVKAGGHLIISSGAGMQELAKAGEPLAGALPMEHLGTRELKMQDLTTLRGQVSGHSEWFRELEGDTKPLIQITGDLKPAARVVISGVEGRPGGFLRIIRWR